MIDDVVMGCVDPVGEAGGDIARMGALAAGLGDKVPGVQINRFCASGLDSVNFAAAQIMAGQHDMTIGGGVELMSRVGIGSAGGAWPVDPSRRDPGLFHAAGHLRRSDRDQIRFFARRCRRLRGRKRRSAPAAAWEAGHFKNSIAPVKDVNGLTLLDHDEHMRPEDRHAVARRPEAIVRDDGRAGRLRCGGDAAHPEVERINHVHHAGNSSASSTARRRCCSATKAGKRRA